jgi:hypothetical protein
MFKRLKAWYRGYGEYPEWFSFCSLVFALSSLTFIVLLFGSLLLGGDIISYGMYLQALFATGPLYIVIFVATFIIATISGIPIFWYQRKRMRKI